MRSPGFETRKLSGWGRYPQESCHVYRPEKNSGVTDILKSGSDHSYISRGLGRSYGDAALNQENGVISHTRLNRFLSFDPETGVLECEAGVSFAEIIQHFLPRGYFLPVTPGTKFVTLGGAIAADIHGKNHHRDGSLGNFIFQFHLLAPGGQVFTCGPHENPEIFWATLGGMGLTGIILRARVRLRRVETAYIQVDYQKARHLDEALSAMTETDDRYEYSVAWVDCLARGPSLGRSILMRGNHARASELGRRHGEPFALPRPPRFKAPFDLPQFALNRFSVRAFNALYYARYSNAESRLVHFEKFFYPLDAVENWNRLYGKRGFVQYQVALPL
ncbi:MAG TPA: FAD-binding oxidoreductase, partial [Terriglobia bacterium]|nr:FAD-binding oxidoreductase [Terriglobia bacterium]